MLYLTTRVSKSNRLVDCYKIKRVLSFLKQKIDNNKRIIGASSLQDLYTWVDTSYTVLPNMTGAHWGSNVLWKGNCSYLVREAKVECQEQYIVMESQRYPLKNNILLQDNQSIIHMEQNLDSKMGKIIFKLLEIS